MTTTAVEAFRSAVGGSGQTLISGEVQFWRMDPADWEPALHAVRDLGIRHVATYLSWRRHEPVQGSVDFDGKDDPRLDVKGFLRLCRDLDLSVQLKPGPWICAEEPGGGLPDWLLAGADLIALDHLGNPVSGYNPPFKHPMPSYASAGFRKLVRRWYEQVWTALEEFTGPSGPIVATQLDNEPSLGFQDSMYGFDYHPEALATFRSFAAKHHAIADAVPPRPGVQTNTEDAWTQHQQAYISDYLAWLQGVNAECGVGHLVDFVNLNTHPVRGVPQNGPSIVAALRHGGRAAVVGEDHYFEPPVDLADLTGLAIACAQGADSGTTLVWAPEMQSGIWRSPGEHVGYPDPTALDLATWWGAAIMFGYQGFNLYMLVDRENWEFAPISPEGEERELAHALRRFMETVASVPDLAAFRPVADVNLAWSTTTLNRAYRTAGTQSAPLAPWSEPGELRPYALVEQAASRLVEAGIHFRLCTSADDIDPLLPTVVADDDWPGYEGDRVSPEYIIGLSLNRLKEFAAPALVSGDGGSLVRMLRAPDGRQLAAVVGVGRGVTLEVADSRIVSMRELHTGITHEVVSGTVTLPAPAGLMLLEM